DMIRAGWSPSVRIFEAAACGVPIISDYWAGLGELLKVDDEILVARRPEDTMRYLLELTERERRAIGRRARQRVLRSHTAAHRAAELEHYLEELLNIRVSSSEFRVSSCDRNRERERPAWRGNGAGARPVAH